MPAVRIPLGRREYAGHSPAPGGQTTNPRKLEPASTPPQSRAGNENTLALTPRSPRAPSWCIYPCSVQGSYVFRAGPLHFSRARTLHVINATTHRHCILPSRLYLCQSFQLSLAPKKAQNKAQGDIMVLAEMLYPCVFQHTRAAHVWLAPWHL